MCMQHLHVLQHHNAPNKIHHTSVHKWCMYNMAVGDMSVITEGTLVGHVAMFAFDSGMQVVVNPAPTSH